MLKAGDKVKFVKKFESLDHYPVTVDEGITGEIYNITGLGFYEIALEDGRKVRLSPQTASRHIKVIG